MWYNLINKSNNFQEVIMLEPIYLDLHIHTSDDADKINENYDVKK